jgi:NAD(P)-dependent dehydrogenase (short-subunit alcohol dehydrogenase family)
VTRLFDGELALVTGAGRGIGRAIALELAAAGARVALLARSVDELDEVAAAVRDRGGTAGVFPADAADPAQVAGAMTRITAEMGRVSILISNAAVVWPLGRIVNVSNGIAAHPAGMIGGNAYATTNAALEAHAINLAAELAGSGGNGQRLPSWVGGYRHASVDPRPVAGKDRRAAARALITAGQSAQSLMDHLASDATGEIWNVNSNRPVK